jgi:hypothetical protein
VDDFRVKYVGREHAEHLMAALKEDYEAVSVDWEGKLYCEITLDWDYANRTVNLSMPGYVATSSTAQISAPNAQPLTRCTIQEQSTTIWNKITTHR